MTTRAPTSQITPRSPRRPCGLTAPDPRSGIIPPQTVRALRQTAFQFAACLLFGFALILAAGLYAHPVRSHEPAPAASVPEAAPAGPFFLDGHSAAEKRTVAKEGRGLIAGALAGRPTDRPPDRTLAVRSGKLR